MTSFNTPHVSHVPHSHVDTQAASEPNSIAPMAIDVNLWEIDLRNLRSGERLDFAVPLLAEREDDSFEPAPTIVVRRPPSSTGRVLGAMTAMLLVAGLGLAAFKGRPTLQRAFASASAKTRVAQTTTPPAVAPPVVAAPVIPAPVIPTPVAAAPPIVAAPPVVAATPAAPATLSASDLPNAPVKKGKRGGKRSTK